MLDKQVKHLDELLLRRLGEWLQQKYLQCQRRKTEAERKLKKGGEGVDFLKEQWKLQVAAQTKPSPRTSFI